LAANINGGMLRLIASRHDDDDDEYAMLVHCDVVEEHTDYSG